MNWSPNRRTEALIRLGEEIRSWFPQEPNAREQGFQLPVELVEIIQKSIANNPWFTTESIHYALWSWGQALQEQDIMAWRSSTSQEIAPGRKRIALITAGNIPLVGLHDVLTIWLSGQTALCKLSSQDPYLLPFLWNRMNPKKEEDFPIFEPAWPTRDFDAIIATGSDNTNRYFESYFGSYPHIFRKNRTSIAMLSGQETETEIRGIVHDAFRYFGLGCRNVSKLFVPEGYEFEELKRAIRDMAVLETHNKYANNYHYQRAIALMNAEEVVDTGTVLLKHSKSYHAPVACLNYDYYADTEDLQAQLKEDRELLQCKVRAAAGDDWILPGQTQRPGLMDYADGVNSLEFVLSLNHAQ